MIPTDDPPAYSPDPPPELLRALDTRETHHHHTPTGTPGVPTRTVREIIRHLEARIDVLEAEAAADRAHIATLEAARTGLVRVAAKVVLELASDEKIKASIASSVTYVGYAIAVAILVTVGASVTYGDLSIGAQGEDLPGIIGEPAPIREPPAVPATATP